MEYFFSNKFYKNFIKKYPKLPSCIEKFYEKIKDKIKDKTIICYDYQKKQTWYDDDDLN